jgi:integrase
MTHLEELNRIDAAILQRNQTELLWAQDYCRKQMRAAIPNEDSHATWMVEAGANPKDVQGQMRHSRISTTMDIYAQFVPESQRRALAKMSAMVESRTSKPVAATGSISMPPQSRMVN